MSPLTALDYPAVAFGAPTCFNYLILVHWATWSTDQLTPLGPINQDADKVTS